jgi:hypothetical protein
MIEIAISLGVIGFALVAIIGILPLGMSVQRENREETIINHDASVLMDAICNGQQGLDDLTNYVVAITNYQTWYPNNGGQSQAIYGYTYTSSTTNPQYPLVDGFRIVGLLSTPKYYIPPGGGGYYSNHVVAIMRSMSGAASDKFPQNNASVQDLAFTYRLTSEVMPYGTIYNGRWDPGWQNYVQNYVAAGGITASNAAMFLEYQHFANTLQADLYEVRLLFRWPVQPNGTVGNAGRQVARGVTSGAVLPSQLQPFVNLQTTPFFAQPRTF